LVKEKGKKQAISWVCNDLRFLTTFSSGARLEGYSLVFYSSVEQEALFWEDGWSDCVGVKGVIERFLSKKGKSWRSRNVRFWQLRSRDLLLWVDVLFLSLERVYDYWSCSRVSDHLKQQREIVL
jgi:hypothetical protein